MNRFLPNFFKELFPEEAGKPRREVPVREKPKETAVAESSGEKTKEEEDSDDDEEEESAGEKAGESEKKEG